MKKYCFLLSIVGHALAWLIILMVRFQVTIHPEPARLVTIRIAEPPLVLAADPAARPATSASLEAAGRTGPAGPVGPAMAVAPGTGGGVTGPGGAPPFPALRGFSLKKSVPGSFRLAPVGRNPDPWAVPLELGEAPRALRFQANAYRPGTVQGASGGSGGDFLLPFDIGEKAVAEWTASVLARIERNWIIPASGRLGFPGRVQISLTVEREGRQRTLVVDESNAPELLTRAALHAVEASLPFPPLPERVAGESFAFTFVFTYNG